MYIVASSSTSDLTNSIRYYLSERFRLRFEDAGLDDMMDESTESRIDEVPADQDANAKFAVENISMEQLPEDEGVDLSSFPNDDAAIVDIINSNGAMRTLDGELAGDEFARDAVNYQILLNKIEKLLDRLKLDA